MKYKFGFIGTGNMGSALARGAAEKVPAGEIMLSNKPMDSAKKLASELGCASGDNCSVAENCKYIFIGVKPQVIESLFTEIAPVLAARQDRFILVSMAAGVKIERIRALAGIDCPIIRIMPNVAASVGEGMILMSSNSLVDECETDEFCICMAGAGRIDRIDEKFIDVGCALSGSGPAFVFMFIEALADGAVNCGLGRASALEYAAQTLLGSSKLLLESGRHPGDLKDAVCSPGGTTIAGVGALEAAGFRGAVMDAVKAAYERACELGK